MKIKYIGKRRIMVQNILRAKLAELTYPETWKQNLTSKIAYLMRLRVLARIFLPVRGTRKLYGNSRCQPKAVPIRR